MNIFTKTILGITISLATFSCASSDCTKIITIAGYNVQTQYGSAYIPGYDLEVPCDYVILPIEEQPKLKDFSYEVLQFQFTPNTGENTARLEYKIKLNNLSNQTAKGFPILTTDADGVVGTGGYRSNACEQIEANSSCIISYDQEFPLNTSIGFTKSVTLVKVEYFITK